MSREAALKNGYLRIIGDLPVGDPALLLPMFISPNIVRHKLGIVPHFRDYDYFKKKYGNKYFVIDVSTSDVIRVTNDITSCECILSSSLHGLIVAHAYNIPALWIERQELIPGSHGYKFRDYFSSIGILYEPFKKIETILSSMSDIDRLFHENGNIVLPNVDLNVIRNNLLKSAPFPQIII